MIANLNPAQKKAVQTLSGPLLVLAGAGTGKTRVVTFRIAELIRSGIRPSRILAVTFTNKAAREMKHRVAELLGKKLKEQPVVSTFHSHCVRILRRHIRKLGYPTKFAIYDRGDQEMLARKVLREVRAPTALLRPGDLLYAISSWKSRSMRPATASAEAQSDKEHLAAMAYRRYQTALKNAGAVDFDDLLLCSEDLLSNYPEARIDEASRFDHLLIDEYQDTNGSQYRIVKALAKDHQNLCVVGDDDQSIYSWRGADVEHILRFGRDWPNATVVRLEQNYRSTAAILELANRLIAFNKKRHDKVLIPARQGGEKPKINQYKDEIEEAQSVVQDINRLVQTPGVELRDCAILFRTNEQPRAFETELRRTNTPYILLGGMSFFDRKEVRDILAYLRVLDSPQDEVSLLRIINNPPRGIGQKTVATLLNEAVSEGIPLWDILVDGRYAKLVSKNAAESVDRFVKLIMEFQKRLEQGSLVNVVQGLIAEIKYEAELARIYPDENERQSRWAAVEETVNALGSYIQRKKKPTLSGFIDETALGENDFGDEKDNQLKQNAVALLTLHSAKGLEYPYVFMVGMEDGLLPHRRSIHADGDAIDEERRLCYVGLTRAQEQLSLSLALTRMKWGKARETIPSRFLFEIIGKADNPHAMAKAKKTTSQPVSAPHSSPTKGRPKPTRGAKKNLGGK